VASKFLKAAAARCSLSIALTLLTSPAFGQAAPEVSLANVLADASVGEAIVAKFGTDHHLDATNIEVAVRSGIVQLGGTVATWRWRERAARVALVVNGVRGVVNRVRVVPVRRPDGELRKRVRVALRDEPALQKLGIIATVARGVVELRGRLTTWEQQELAERVVTSIPGVRFCQNLLTSRGTGARTAEHVANDVRSRLDWDPLVQHDPIRVTVHAARVELSGTTGSVAERARVIALAWVEGVVSVDARALIVDSVRRPDATVRPRRPSDLEIAEAIGDLMPFWPSLSSSNPQISVATGVVILSGAVKTPAEKRALEHMARSAAGVVRVDSDLRGPWSASPARRRPTRRR
jgi:osmotically-inducible protein OsmY